MTTVGPLTLTPPLHLHTSCSGSKRDRTATMKAAEKGHHDTMKLLIDNGADINLGNWVREWGRVANKRR